MATARTSTALAPNFRAIPPQDSVRVLPSKLFLCGSFPLVYVRMCVVLGGGVALLPDTATSVTPSCSFVNTQFESCNAHTAGCLLVDKAQHVLLQGTQFKKCVSTTRAGGVYMFSSNVSVDLCVFAENNAQQGGGGGIFHDASNVRFPVPCLVNALQFARLGPCIGAVNRSGLLLCPKTPSAAGSSAASLVSVGSCSASNISRINGTDYCPCAGVVTNASGAFCPQMMPVTVNGTCDNVNSSVWQLNEAKYSPNRATSATTMVAQGSTAQQSSGTTMPPIVVSLRDHYGNPVRSIHRNDRTRGTLHEPEVTVTIARTDGTGTAIFKDSVTRVPMKSGKGLPAVD